MVSVSEFKAGFIRNTKSARDASGYSVSQMAELLGLKTDTYEKYEKRTYLPRHLVPKFCLICRIPVDNLFRVEEVAVKPRPFRGERGQKVAKAH